MATQDEYRAKAREALEKLQQQIDELKVQANLAGAEARDRFDTNVRSAGSAAKAGRKAFLDEWKKQREAREKLIDSA